MMQEERITHYYSALQKRGEIYKLIGKVDDALKDHDHIISHCKESDKAHWKFRIDAIISYSNTLCEHKSDYSNALKYANMAIEKTKNTEDAESYGLALKTAGIIFLRKGDYDRSLKYFQQAISILEKINNTEMLGPMYNEMGLLYRNKGELDKALEYFNKFLFIMKKYDNKVQVGVALANIGAIYWRKGKLDKALDFMKRSLKIGEEIHAIQSIGKISNDIGLIYLGKGKPDQAVKYFERFLSISNEIGFREGIAIASVNIGIIYAQREDYKTALRYFKNYLSISEEIGYTKGIGIGCMNIGHLYLYLSDLKSAEKYLKRSIKIFEKSESLIQLSEAYQVFSELNSLRKRYPEALAFAEKALGASRQASAKANEINSLIAIAKAAVVFDPERSIKSIKEAMGIAQKEGLDVLHGECIAEFTRIMMKLNKKKEAEDHLIEAGRIFKEADAKSLLKAVEKQLREIRK
ncbi:tetratricopeptide repeat protein [Candidatus Calescamantes bacterium]|nr:tetratricopeptide repeat protein [Candidatus Calescamantes bacterium]